ncbi:MAG: hypothetical protein J6Z36_05170, partial [Clostridia bacterium]|nr:hypothetical protein [Clostridia bacterium]
MEKLQESKKQAAACARRIQEIERTIASTETAILQKQARLREMQKKSDMWRERVADLDRQIASFDKAALQDRVKELSSFADLTKLQNEMGSLSARQAAISERMQEINEAITKEEKRRAGLFTELALCGEKKRQLEDFISSEDSIIAEQNEVIRLARDKYDRINRDIYSCNARIDSINTSMDVYVGLKNRFEGYRDSVRRLMTAGQHDPQVGRKLKGTVADLIHCEEKYELAMETILGGAMQNVVTATAEDARDLIAYLKRNGIGVVTFLPVDSMKSRSNSREAERALGDVGALGLADQIVKYDKYYSPVIKNLLGNTLVCDNNDNAVRIAKKYGYAFRIVTLEGDIIATSGAMTGGSRKKDGSNLLQNERMIKQCEEQIEKFKKEAARLKDGLDRAQDERLAAERHLEDLREQFRKAEADLAALR